MHRPTRNRPGNLTPVLPKIQQGNQAMTSPITSVTSGKSVLSEEGKKILDILTEKIDLLLHKIESRDEKIEQLKTENITLKRTIVDMELRIDEVENSERRSNIIVSGDLVPIASPNEVTSHLAINLFERYMNYKLDSSNVITAYRLGTKPLSQVPDRRRILVKLRDRDIKQDIITACRSAKPHGLFLGDDLTQARASVLYALRQVKKRCSGKIEYCGSRDGKVFIWKKSTGGRNMKIFINSREQFAKICSEEFEIDPVQFIKNR